MKNSCDCHTLCHFILTKTVTLVVLLIRLTGDSDCGLKLDTFDSFNSCAVSALNLKATNATRYEMT